MGVGERKDKVSSYPVSSHLVYEGRQETKRVEGYLRRYPSRRFTVAQVAEGLALSPIAVSEIVWYLINRGIVYLTWDRKLRLRPPVTPPQRSHVRRFV
jgi:hypothetical protein